MRFLADVGLVLMLLIIVSVLLAIGRGVEVTHGAMLLCQVLFGFGGGMFVAGRFRR